MVLPLEVPVRVTVIPAVAGLIVPEMAQVCKVKLTLGTFAPLTVTLCEAELHVDPPFVGVTVYVLLAKPLKL